MAVTIYTSKTCGPCAMAKKLLDRIGLSYEVKDIADPQYASEAYNLAGCSMVPVIVTDSETIVGYQPARILAQTSA